MFIQQGGPADVSRLICSRSFSVIRCTTPDFLRRRIVRGAERAHRTVVFYETSVQAHPAIGLVRHFREPFSSRSFRRIGILVTVRSSDRA